MDGIWPSPPENLKILPGEAHIFRMPLEPAPERLARLADLLTPEEQARAARYYFEEGRRSFTAARGQMREVLGWLLGRPPGSLIFEAGERGKPYLPGADLHFNLSHSGKLALLAVMLRSEVGVDIEWTPRKVDFMELAPRFFAPAEAQALVALPESEQREAFFSIWTRKEAYIKACGQGLYLPLHSFTVSHGEPPAISVPGFSIRSLRPGPGYAAALVAEGEIGTVKLWDWSPEEVAKG